MTVAIWYDRSFQLKDHILSGRLLCVELFLGQSVNNQFLYNVFSKQKKPKKPHWFLFLKCEYFLFFLVFYVSKLNYLSICDFCRKKQAT